MNKLWLIIGIIAVIGFFYFGSGFLTVIGVSEITVENQGQYFVTTIAVNQSGDTVKTIPKFSKTDSSGNTFSTNASFDIRFSPKTAYCGYNLTPNSDLFGLVKYYEVSSSFHNAPFHLEVLRTPGNSNEYVEDFLGDFDAFSQPSIKIQSNFGGNLTITNVGNLVQGYQCPTTNFVVLQWFDKKYLLDKSQFTQKLNLIKTNCTNPATALNCISSISLINVPKPSEWANFNGTLYIDQLKYPLPASAIPIVTVTVSKEFADGVYVTAFDGQPQISVSQSNLTVFTNAQANFNVTVKNIGTSSGQFTLTSNSQGKTQVYPQLTQTEPIGPNSTSNPINFTVQGNVLGNDQVCITASNNSQFLPKTAQSCVAIEVKQGAGTAFCGNGNCEFGENSANCLQDCPVTPNSCGNKVCDFGESITCPSDCIPGQLTCNYPTVPVQKSEPILFGLLGTATTQSCQFDPVLIMGAIAALILVLLFLKFKK